MGAGMKHAREEEPVSLALSLSTGSTASTTTSADSAGAVTQKKRARPGQGEFVCKTCGRAFASFQALGGHRTSHLRGRHGLELGVGVAKAIRDRKRSEDKHQAHECHSCGLDFETGQALGGHMRRHREEVEFSGGVDQWVIAQQDQQQVSGHAADRKPVLLELFV